MSGDLVLNARGQNDVSITDSLLADHEMDPGKQ